MRRRFWFLVLSAACAIQPAFADFQLNPVRSQDGTGSLSSRAAVPAPPAAIPAPPIDLSSTLSQPYSDTIVGEAAISAKPIRRPQAASVPLAVGFGRQVPLSFAARQIVPRQHTVAFAADVDEAVLVDWTGGHAWDQTLRSALRPLGLKATLGKGRVLISRG